jgi:hypothetical protein
MPFLGEWRAERQRRRRAALYVQGLLADPSPADARWLADAAAGGDVDHAAWELRYARRALGLLGAQRDALDDRTASLVAHALSASFGADPLIDPDKREVAERQFNTRLGSYREALAARGSREGTGVRLARMLLAYAGRVAPGPEELARAADLLSGYLAESNEALRREFGVAALPEHLPPSAARGASG